MSSLRHTRFPLATFVAVAGMLCVAGGASASTGRARAAEMFRDGCCCVTKPASGCCCETDTPLNLSPPAVESPGVLPVVTAERVQDSRSGSCRCSLGDPVAPGSKPQPNPVENETRSGEPLSLVAFFAATERPPVTFDRSVSARGSPPKSPLYLCNSRLLI